MSLDRYRAKRDFDATPEPLGAPRTSGKTLAFFIQRHHARALHYDFRIELDGVLKSWAVPKGPSLEPADKRLAVRVEDHPLEYGRFEGTIPPHQYGAGEVVLWDRGNWTPDGDPAAGLRKGHLTFALDGQKLQGRWALVRMGRADPKKENWLLIKEADAAARHGSQADITGLRPESVAGAAHAGKGVRGAASAAPIAAARAAGPAGAPMPDFPPPQLAMLSDRVPEGDQWLSEMKFDGYRGLCRIDRSGARILTREGHDWSARWPALVAALSALGVDDAWIDGEVIALLADNSISFEALQDPEKFPGARLAFYAFDLPYLNGHDLRALPLRERKALLRDLIPGTDGKLLYSEHIVGNAAAAFEHACTHGLEGIVAKRLSAPYTGKRDGNWLKIKCQRRQEFVIGGFTEPGGQRCGFGALLLGIHDGAGKLHYAGRVGTGFDDAQLALLSRKFRRLERRAPAFVDPPRGSMARGVHWLAPQLVAEVKFAQWTQAGMVRHASFVALRADKPARSVVREMPSATAGQDVPAAAGTGTALSHPDKVLYPGAGLTKRDMADYYEAVSQWMLPHLIGRPLTMVRCPEGVGGKCFFQKHIAAGVPAAIARVTVNEAGGNAQYMMIEDAAGLIATVQMNGLEIHALGASKKQLSRPDRLVFDLDPAPGVAWRKVIEGALLIRTLLEEIGLTVFLKTSGGKGLHLVLPIACNHEWPVIKAWTKGVAEHLAATLPDHFTAKISKSAREGKIFIDYLRNTEGATTVAAYSPRARANAPVSTPIAWEELGPDLRADAFRVADVPARLAQMKTDPWADYAQTRQKISAKMLRLFA